MIQPMRFCFSLLFLLLAVPISFLADPLKAGVAKVDITPPPGVAMWGYFDRKSPAKGTLDPLLARVLVLEVGEKRLALVAVDLGRPFGPASLELLRENVRKASGISCVLIVASHTHAGPIIQDEYPANGTPPWESSALVKISKAVEEAHQHCVEARLGTGYGVAYIGHNRRRVNPDGTVTMFWRNETKVPTAPVDPTVSVLRVDTAAWEPLAVLVNYACHPVVFGPDNLQYSADFPAVMTQSVEQALGSQSLCIFLQGAPGDINPYFDKTPLEQDAVKMRDWTGKQLGREAARVAKAIQTEAVREPSLDFAEDLLPFRLRWHPEKFRQGLIKAVGPDVFETYGHRIQQQMQLPVSAVLINKRIALMGMPGEPFVEFQVNWRDRCPVPDAFFLGYANGYFGYFPTLLAATEGGYGAASATTWVEPGAGERMVDHALAKIYEMLGRLRNLPDELRKTN
jgi:neutral ceramidase